MLAKFKSRKFLMALLSVILGVLTMVGVEDGIVQQVSSVAMIIIPTIVYIAVEGKIDSEGVKKVVDTIQDVVEEIIPDEKESINIKK